MQKKMKIFLLRLVDCFTKILCVYLVLGCLGCGASIQPFSPIKTRHIEFHCEQMINNRQDLAIDVVYVTYVHELRELTRLGAKQWFKGQHRAEWKFKESITVQGGDTLVVKLDPIVLKRTVLLVIYADYQNVLLPTDLQVIVDFAGKKREVIEVKNTGLQARNKSLRYVK